MSSNPLRMALAPSRSNDLNDIEFSFEEKPRERAGSSTKRAAEKKPKILTADVIARIRAVDCEDTLLPRKAVDQETTTKNPAQEKGSKVELVGQSIQHIAGLKETIGQTGRFIIKTVDITKSSTEPLGFFIRLGDGLEKKSGIFVSRVSQGSVVDSNGLLQVGDEILEVNRVDVQGFGVDDVVKMIQIPRHLILTIKVSAYPRKQRSSSENGVSKEGTRREQKGHTKTRQKNTQARANNYRQGSGDQDKQNQQQTMPASSHKTDNNANDVRGFSAHSPTKEGSTIEGLISALRSQKETSHIESPKQTGVIDKLSRTEASPSRTAAVQRPSSRDKTEQMSLSRKPPPSNGRKSSTLVPATTVNLIFEDSEPRAIPPHALRRRTSADDHGNGESSNDVKTRLKSGSAPSSTFTGYTPPSPSSSPKARRRLPSVPAENLRDNKPLLTLPSDRTKRQLPTPPPSPPPADKTHAKQEARDLADRRSWAGFEDSDRDKGVDISSTEKESGLSVTQLISALTFHKEHSDGSEERGKSDRAKSASGHSRRPTRKSESHYSDIVEQQRLLQAHASGNSRRPKMLSRSSHPEMIKAIPEESKGGAGTSALKLSPFSRRRSIATTTPDKSLSDAQDMSPDSCHEKEPGFMVYPDDYRSENMKSSHAVSGMISMHLVKAVNLLFADRKLLEKKKKVYCAVEVDSERKAFTTSKRASRTLSWYEVFEVEIQHGRQVALSCFTADRDLDKPIAAVAFTLAPFVRCGQSHKVIFKLHPQGCLHVEMEFIEMKTLLKRAPSDRKSGVFGFQLNVTSRLENSNVPLVVRKCIEEIDKRGLDVMGLYRISGNARRKRQLRAQFDEDSNSVDLSEENNPDINVITGILKDYLRELPQPLIPPQMAQDLVKTVEDNVVEQNVSIQKRVLSKMLEQLPESNRETLIYLVNHLLRVIAHQESNKMDAHNLSVCLGPVLLCPPSNLTDSKDLLDLKLHVRVVGFLLDLWKKVDNKN